ncbi:hypothetical protein [Chitinibacter sp. S2-10]|uniref:hypothetical protein n=1 Tax=Chitinibacter sp. S2-10 TaxID=3373597 RepID=UPI003977389D
MKANRLFLAIVFALGGGLAFAAQIEQPAAKTVMHAPSGVKYLVGGVGDDEKAALDAVKADYNCRLTFAVKMSGAYLADVTVRVVNLASQAEVLNLVVPGPFLLANLPAGKYSVSAVYRGEMLTTELTIKANQAREHVFRFAQE